MVDCGATAAGAVVVARVLFEVVVEVNVLVMVVVGVVVVVAGPGTEALTLRASPLDAGPQPLTRATSTKSTPILRPTDVIPPRRWQVIRGK